MNSSSEVCPPTRVPGGYCISSSRVFFFLQTDRQTDACARVLGLIPLQGFIVGSRSRKYQLQAPAIIDYDRCSRPQGGPGPGDPPQGARAPGTQGAGRRRRRFPEADRCQARSMLLSVSEFLSFSCFFRVVFWFVFASLSRQSVRGTRHRFHLRQICVFPLR